VLEQPGRTQLRLLRRISRTALLRRQRRRLRRIVIRHLRRTLHQVACRICELLLFLRTLPLL
jgi:hypothetical protein